MEGVGPLGFRRLQSRHPVILPAPVILSEAKDLLYSTVSTKLLRGEIFCSDPVGRFFARRTVPVK